MMLEVLAGNRSCLTITPLEPRKPVSTKPTATIVTSHKLLQFFCCNVQDAWRKDAAEPSLPSEAPEQAAGGSKQGADTNPDAGSKKPSKVKAKHRALSDAHVGRPDGQPDSGATLASRAQGEQSLLFGCSCHQICVM